MNQVEGYVVLGREDHVFLLKKSLDGLKQSLSQWDLRFDSFMIKLGCKKYNYDFCVYFKDIGYGKMIYLLLYIDDMLITCHDRDEISYLKGLLSSELNERS